MPVGAGALDGPVAAGDICRQANRKTLPYPEPGAAAFADARLPLNLRAGADHRTKGFPLGGSCQRRRKPTMTDEGIAAGFASVNPAAELAGAGSAPHPPAFGRHLYLGMPVAAFHCGNGDETQNSSPNCFAPSGKAWGCAETGVLAHVVMRHYGNCEIVPPSPDAYCLITIA